MKHRLSYSLQQLDQLPHHYHSACNGGGGGGGGGGVNAGRLDQLKLVIEETKLYLHVAYLILIG